MKTLGHMFLILIAMIVVLGLFALGFYREGRIWGCW